MSVLDIHVLGDPILREVTTPVVTVDDELRRLIDDMFETMYVANGVGLAAPQVGRRERLAVLDVGGGPIAVINPEVVAASGRQRAEEGCLSIPEIFGDVERAMHVTVRALDAQGEPFELEGSELLARCLQHEIDHLHGKLFLDYLSLLKRRSALAKWEKMKTQFPNFVRRLTPAEAAEHHGGAEEAL